MCRIVIEVISNFVELSKCYQNFVELLPIYRFVFKLLICSRVYVEWLSKLFRIVVDLSNSCQNFVEFSICCCIVVELLSNCSRVDVKVLSNCCRVGEFLSDASSILEGILTFHLNYFKFIFTTVCKKSNVNSLKFHTCVTRSNLNY